MTRSKAISRVRKLRALAADKAATGPEKKLAKQRADELVERFELSEAEVAPEPTRRRPRMAPQPGFGWSPTTNTTWPWSSTVNATFTFTTSNR